MAVALNLISFYKSRDIPDQRFETANIKILNSENFTPDNDKPLLVHFWATWCPVCKIENSTVNSLAKDYQVLTIAVNSGDNGTLKDFMKKNSLEFKTVNDQKGYFSKLYNIQAFPATLIFDKNGNLVFSEVGYTSSPGLRIRLFWASLV